MAKHVRYVGRGTRVLEAMDLELLGIKTHQMSELVFNEGYPTTVTNAVAKVLTDSGGRTAGEFVLVSDEEMEANATKKAGDPDLQGSGATDQSISGGPSHNDGSLGSSEAATGSEVGTHSNSEVGTH